MKKSLLGLTAAGLLASTASAGFGADLGAFVSARKGYMLMMAMNAQTLGAMAKGETAYDPAVAKVAAGNITALAGMDTSFFWVAGTDGKSLKQSNALPGAIGDAAGRSEKIAALRLAADKLAAAAGDGLPALSAAMAPLGGACGDCHKAYRMAN